MTLSQRLDIRQTQSLVMTPQLQQAIKLLQMSNMELADFVAQELENNPLLERGDDAPVADFDGASSDNQETGATEGGDPEPMSGDEGDLSAGEDYWDDQNYNPDDSSFGESKGSTASDGDGDYDAVQNVAEQPSLRDHLMEQVNVDILEPADRMIAAALVEMLDERGYLPPDLDLVRTQLGATPEHFESVIQTLQKFDPTGIFARDLRECLALQLKEKDRCDPAMEKLLDNLDLLAKRDKVSLLKICGVDAEDLAQMIDEIKQLNPKPAQAFTSDVAQPVTPDVILRPMAGGQWHVELNTENLPKVLANTRYYSQIQGGVRSKADKEYISERWQQANWLVKALHQRAETILKVATEIVRQQDKFFVHGVQHLKPLVLRDIATAIEMHESTVSRVTQNKFIATPRGLFELKYFFTTALTRGDGGEAVSSEAVRERIRALIQNEDPKKILSDDRIAEILCGEGVNVARRTVAKYREAIHIPSSAQRRREKNDRPIA